MRLLRNSDTTASCKNLYPPSFLPFISPYLFSPLSRTSFFMPPRRSSRLKAKSDVASPDERPTRRPAPHPSRGPSHCSSPILSQGDEERDEEPQDDSPSIQPLLHLVLHVIRNPSEDGSIFSRQHSTGVDPFVAALNDIWRHRPHDTKAVVSQLKDFAEIAKLLDRLRPFLVQLQGKKQKEKLDNFVAEIEKWKNPPGGQSTTATWNEHDRAFVKQNVRMIWQSDVMRLFHHPVVGGAPLASQSYYP